MHSVKATFAAAFVFFLSTRAQYTIDPSSVPIQTRQTWCTNQQSTCPLLCLQLPGASSSTTSNTCDPTSLTYSCVCGNGLSPNASEYSQTIPYYMCQEWGQQCVAGCAAHDNACQSACTQDHPCGALNPTRVNVTSTSSVASSTAGTAAASSTGAGGQVFTGFGGAAASATATSTPKKSDAQAVLDVGRSYGLAVVMAVLFAGFAQMI